MTIISGGCKHPLQRAFEQGLREQMINSNRRLIDAIKDAENVTVTRPPGRVSEFLAERMDEIEAISGFTANENETPDFGRDLTNNVEMRGVHMTLERARALALMNNLDIQLAQLVPAVRETQLVQAQAIFDAVFFATFDLNRQDTPQPPTQALLENFGTVQQDTTRFNTGIRKTLATGGQVSVSSAFTRNRRDPSFFDVDTWYDSDILVSLQQPLLRNFGSDVVRSQIELQKNARDQSAYQLIDQLMRTVADTEQAYWELAFTHHQLLFFQRLVRYAKRGLDIVEPREMFDASSVEVSQIRAFYQEQHFNMIDARRQVLQASDQLKALIYSPDLPLSSEDVIMPLDKLVESPLDYNLYDALMTALQHRPDLRQRLSEIEDASIRQRVADNQRLPLLDLTASARLQGLSFTTEGETYDSLNEANFIDYVLSLNFEAPIGNREREAGLQQRRIEKQGAVINYQRNVQAAALEVKTALRQLTNAYILVGEARESRLASADTVRALRSQMKHGTELTPNFIDLVISREEDLARREIREARALSDYNIAITRLYQSMGTLLKRNGIELDPDLQP